MIKRIKTTHLKEQERKEVRNESRILQALNHPNIIKFERAFKDRELNWNIVMEYADGGSLDKLIEQRKAANQPLSEDEILDMFTQICLAIKHVHDRKILHRDIKDENIFLTRGLFVKLGDFGISKALSGTRAKAATLIGTDYCIAPEVLTSKPYNTKCDIWSLGILLYKMTTFELPWPIENIQQALEYTTQCRYPSIQGDYSNGLKNIIQMCLQKSPGQRPTINALLKTPVLNKRIKKYLDNNQFRDEFSHTVLHNQNTLQMRNKLAQMVQQEGSEDSAAQVIAQGFHPQTTDQQVDENMRSEMV